MFYCLPFSFGDTDYSEAPLICPSDLEIVSVVSQNRLNFGSKYITKSLYSFQGTTYAPVTEAPSSS